MDININTDILFKYNLTISEYIYLNYIYNDVKDPELYAIIDQVDDMKLQSEGYIKIMQNGIVLRDKGKSLFEGDSLFLKFLNTFPIKAPSGRYLSPVGSDGKLAKKVQASFKKAFGTKPHLAEKAILVLEAELAWRKRTNNLEYINNIDTWLKQANYEKFEYLLEENLNKDRIDTSDLM